MPDTGKEFGRYRLLQRIARGGMAEVWKARYAPGDGVEKTVVVKRILQDYADDEDFVTMFRDEARLSLLLSHANIVQVFDYGKVGEEPFLAMEWVDGQNLRSVLRRSEEGERPGLNLGVALHIAAEIARGLAYAHSRRDDAGTPLGIVHRDITPTNVLVSYAGEVKIADFGIARAASRSTRTRSGVVRGKPGYLPPEAVRERPYDGRADVFSLGAVLWEMIAGRKLVLGDSDLAVIGRIASGEPFARLADHAGVPPEVDAVVMRALEREPEDRYADAQAFHDALAPLAAAHGGTPAALTALMDQLFAGERASEAAAAQRALETTSNTASTAKLLDAKAAGTSATLSPPRPSKTRAGITVGVIAAVAVAIAAANGAFGPSSRATSPTPTPVMTLSLVDPSPSPIPSVDETPVPIATPSPRKTAILAASATPALAPGIVGVSSKPAGEIFIDGVATGRETPAWNLQVPVGRHTIRIVNPVTKLEATIEVDVAPGSTTRYPVVELK